MALVMASLAILASCTTTTDTTASPGGATLPTWIDEVTPRPDATYAPTEGVSVRFRLPAAEQEVRLLIDGTDVTSVSEEGPDLLRYDGTPDLVELDAGEHTAEAALVVLDTDGIDTVRVDSYTWTFRLG